jgi:glutamine synthetase
MQAEGFSSDCYLKPVRMYQSLGITRAPLIYVLCEVLDKNNQPHETNDRSKLGEEDTDFWIGFEQEYFIRSAHNKDVLGFQKGGTVDPQGKYYCGVGGQIVGRELSDEHLDYCLDLGINVEGTNAEVALGQWEYQIFSKGKLAAADDLWMSRYILHKLAEKRGYSIELHPKPIQIGEWNGSGLHTNFSNKKMREEGGESYFKSIFNAFETRQELHIENYGSDNHLRLTGKFETQSIDKFSWGVSDRGASIRIPRDTAKNWKGYVEDRRPGSNADPYKIIKEIDISLNTTDQIYDVKIMMSKDFDMEGLNEKYGTISNDELLKEYREE